MREDGRPKHLSELHDLPDRLRKRRVDEVPETVSRPGRLHHPADGSKEGLKSREAREG